MFQILVSILVCAVPGVAAPSPPIEAAMSDPGTGVPSVIDRMKEAMPPSLDEVQVEGRLAQINPEPKPLEWANVTGPFRYLRRGAHRSLEWDQGEARAVKIDDGEIRIDAMIPKSADGRGDNWAVATVFVSKSSEQALGQQEWLLRLPQWFEGRRISALWTDVATTQCVVAGPAELAAETFLDEGESLLRVKCPGSFLGENSLLVEPETYRVRGWESERARILRTRTGTSAIVRWTTQPIMHHMVVSRISGYRGARDASALTVAPISAVDLLARAQSAGATINDERQ